MALGDTAKLIAALELVDKFSPTVRKFEGAVGKIETRTQRLERIGYNIGAGIRNSAFNLQRIAVVGADVIGRNVQLGLESLAELEDVQTQTAAVLESTRGVAGLTATDIRNLAEEYENLNATMDDKVIQSGENLLLTFTNVDKKAFQPALEAALDMNEAMGGGEEGLQQTIVRLGKALQDPIQGATALRRVGVNLSDQQREQIKDLVEQNDLYGAQRIILDELATEFGGSFAAKSDTARAKMAKFADVIEDSRQSLATGFLPVLERLGDRLGDALRDPEVQDRITEFGSSLADAFDAGVEFVTELPWDTIADAAQALGSGVKTALDAFKSLPDWVQTAVLTGWGLNKLTGGALGNIAVDLGKMAFGAIRGGTPATPVYVKEVGLPGVGGAAPVAGAGGGRFAGAGRLLAGLTGVGIAAIIADTIEPEVTGLGTTLGQGWRDAVDDALGVKVPTISPNELEWPFGPKNTPTILPEIFGGNGLLGGTAPEPEEGSRSIGRAWGVLDESIDETRETVRDLNDPLRALHQLQERSRADAAAADRAMLTSLSSVKAAADNTTNSVRTTASNTAAQLSRIESVERTTAANTARTESTLARKNFSPNIDVGVTVNSNVSISDILRQSITQHVATDLRGGWSEI